MFGIKKQVAFVLIALLAMIAVTGCKPGKEGTAEYEISMARYNELMRDGWDMFQQGNYRSGFSLFSAAKGVMPDLAEPYTGAGWCRMYNNELSQADLEFQQGFSLGGDTADLFAGWAFLLSAMQDFSGSRDRLDQAFWADHNWEFSHLDAMTWTDLQVLRAGDNIMLGDWSAALSDIQVLNPGFSVDAGTQSGKADIAAEVERLRGVF